MHVSTMDMTDMTPARSKDKMSCLPWRLQAIIRTVPVLILDSTLLSYMLLLDLMTNSFIINISLLDFLIFKVILFMIL
jgi:hypothetical protein